MIDLNFKYSELIKVLSDEAPFTPDIALILGSGLGDFADRIEKLKTISSTSLPGYPPSTIVGHEGKIHFCRYAEKNILIFQGRIHFYEGYQLSQCLIPVFISYKLGIKKIFLTNAAGGVNLNFNSGDLMLITSFNGINIKKELTNFIGVSTIEGKNNFQNFPSVSLNNIIRKAALESNISLKEGVYWFNKGPAYETPAEIQMVGKMGGDAVGMSTAHEAVFAAYLGLETSSVSLITNMAAGISPNKLSHKEVTDTANLAKDKFESLVKNILKLI